MKPVRSWTIAGDNPLTVKVYRPAMTIRCGDGPESELSPQQVSALTQRLVDIDCVYDAEEFDPEEPEVL